MQLASSIGLIDSAASLYQVGNSVCIHLSRWSVGSTIVCSLVKTAVCTHVAGQRTDKLVYCPAVSILFLSPHYCPSSHASSWVHPVHTHAGVGHYESVSQLTRVSLNNEEVSSVHTCADTSFALTGETHPWSPFFLISSFTCDWFNPQQEAGYTAGATTNMANLVCTQERNRYISDQLTKGGMTACLTVRFVGVCSSCSWLLMFGWTSGFHGNWWSLHCCSDMYV